MIEIGDAGFWDCFSFNDLVMRSYDSLYIEVGVLIGVLDFSFLNS